MGRRRAAAAADDGAAGLEKAARPRGHVLGRAEVDVAPVHDGRRAGVRHRRELRRAHDGGHPLQRVEHGLRALAAVRAHERYAESLQLAHRVLGRVAVDRVARLGEGQAHADRHRRVECARRGERGLRLVERRHRLEEQQVDPALEQALDLLVVRRLRLIRRDVPDRGEGLADRSHGSRHERAAARRLTRDAGPLAVDLAHVRLEAVRPELEAVGAERVRLDHVGAGVEVLLVDLPHESGVREVQLVEAAVEEDAARVEHRAHRPVEDDRPGGEPVEERLHGRGSGSFGHPGESIAPRAGAPDGLAPSAGNAQLDSVRPRQVPGRPKAAPRRPSRRLEPFRPSAERPPVARGLPVREV